jgi:hypothetical protein
VRRRVAEALEDLVADVSVRRHHALLARLCSKRIDNRHAGPGDVAKRRDKALMLRISMGSTGRADAQVVGTAAAWRSSGLRYHGSRARFTASGSF